MLGSNTPIFIMDSESMGRIKTWINTEVAQSLSTTKTHAN